MNKKIKKITPATTVKICVGYCFRCTRVTLLKTWLGLHQWHISLTLPMSTVVVLFRSF